MISYSFSEDVWTSLISVDGLDLQVVNVGAYSKTEGSGGAVMSRCGFRSVCYLEVKVRCKNALGPRIVHVCCSEFGGGRFSEVAKVLQVWDFQSVSFV